MAHFARVDEVRATTTIRGEAGRLFARKLFHTRPHTQFFCRQNVEKEVEILRRLRHHHIIEVVSTYTKPSPDVFAIIMSPSSNLPSSRFFKFSSCWVDGERPVIAGMAWLPSSLVCNILMDVESATRTSSQRIFSSRARTFSFADFGLSRAAQDESSTSGPVTARTNMYCAPEVANEERRGYSSDVFSLGCCFLEMATVLFRERLEDFVKFRGMPGSRAYHANMGKVLRWIILLARKLYGDPSRGSGYPGDWAAWRDSLGVWWHVVINVLLLHASA